MTVALFGALIAGRLVPGLHAALAIAAALCAAATLLALAVRPEAPGQLPGGVIELQSVTIRVGTVGLIGGERMRNHRARMGVAVICLAIVALLAAACGSPGTTVRATSASQKVSGTVVVFAAASLKDAFDTIGKQFEQANPGVTVKFNYAGSSSLASQIKQAAPADVFASADTTNMDTVANDNLASGSPQVFARNTLEIMVAAGNPMHIKSVADLANSDVKVAVCVSGSVRRVHPGSVQEGRRHRASGKRGDQRQLGGHQGHARRG